jgi:protein-S-isoprenylcysteine O-methyltransferase Ste14
MSVSGGAYSAMASGQRYRLTSVRAAGHPMSIWLVGIFLNIFSFILQGLSALVTTLLPADVAFMGGVIYGFVLICFFYALARTVGQNPSLGR